MSKHEGEWIAKIRSRNDHAKKNNALLFDGSEPTAHADRSALLMEFEKHTALRDELRELAAEWDEQPYRHEHPDHFARELRALLGDEDE